MSDMKTPKYTFETNYATHFSRPICDAQGKNQYNPQLMFEFATS